MNFTWIRFKRVCVCEYLNFWRCRARRREDEAQVDVGHGHGVRQRDLQKMFVPAELVAVQLEEARHGHAGVGVGRSADAPQAPAEQQRSAFIIQQRPTVSINFHVTDIFFTQSVFKNPIPQRAKRL